jgi:hypothetical protein
MRMVTMDQVLRWVAAALDAAQRDPGYGKGVATDLSCRRLEVTLSARPGAIRVEVVTWNKAEAAGAPRREYARTTADGIEVRWNATDSASPTGAYWLPVEFVEWMKGGSTS